ncbi:MAG: DUF3606 domain-containing protein [Rubrivivax sp.]|nr:MAG: DUF3606 domain-containing protein [Rubrivivax sp.]
MSDSKTMGAPDGGHINVQEDAELRDWAKKFDVTQEQLKEAVAAVGNLAADVEMHLKGSRASTNASVEAASEGRKEPRNP